MSPVAPHAFLKFSVAAQEPTLLEFPDGKERGGENGKGERGGKKGGIEEILKSYILVEFFLHIIGQIHIILQ